MSAPPRKEEAQEVQSIDYNHNDTFEEWKETLVTWSID
jgi:hypothetical protein